MSLFNNRYRIATTRFRNWDFAAPGWYFLTICTKDRICHFGDVVDSVMGLSPIGVVANAFWEAILSHHTRVCLDAFVIMPNHVHGVICIMEDSHRGLSKSRQPAP